MRHLVIALLSVFVFASCVQNTTEQTVSLDKASAIRPLTSEEKAADFDQLLQMFKSYYGPYQYKEKRFGFSIEKIAQDLKAQAMNAKTDEEFMGYVMQFGAAMKDGHVQLAAPISASNVYRYRTGIALTAIEGKALIDLINPKLSAWTGLKVGDEILSVDSKSPFEIAEIGRKYLSDATDLSNQHAVIYALSRPSFMTELVPQNPLALVKAKTAGGYTITIQIPWTQNKYTDTLDSVVRPRLDLTTPLAREINSQYNKGETGFAFMGNVDPFFMNEKSQAAYGFKKVFPSAESLKKFGLNGDEKPGIYAALYKHDGKNILLMRNATYHPEDYSTRVYLKAYMALMSEFENQADVMVLDQTHNPGGSYCGEFYELFAREGDVQSVQKMRADRKWLEDLFIIWPSSEDPETGAYNIKLYQSWGAIVEKAYDRGDFLSEPIALFASGSPYTLPNLYTWTKPMVVLIDELAGSCGDIFPMLVKANNRAPLFGQTTMGLGGNVEPVGTLNNTRIEVKLTRGLFFPYNPAGVNGEASEDQYVENNGVKPDVSYSHTVADYRNGFVNYIKLFSDEAVRLVK